MSTQRPAWAVKPGMMIVDPSTGCWARVHEIQVDMGNYWLLYGEPRPPGTLGAKVDPQQTLTTRAEGEEEDWDDFIDD